MFVQYWIHFFICNEVPNSVQSDKMVHSEASDLGLHCLKLSLGINGTFFFVVLMEKANSVGQTNHSAV